jgi:large subunit ribosomal protein L10e
MAGLRKFKCYRVVKRSYTRKSKYKSKSYIKGATVCKVVRHVMGNPKKKYKFEVSLRTKVRTQVRDNALESARLSSNRKLDEKIGKTDYFFRIRPYPHHILRENKMLVGAGADRMQTGMKKAFGKVVGVAAQLKKDQKVFSVYVNKANVLHAKEALKAAIRRLPFDAAVKIEDLPEATLIL